jgi:3-dehydroquinate dehydratase II
LRNQILVLNGPNLNALGRREPEKYGHKSLSDLENEWIAWGKLHKIEVVCRQSNHEGILLDLLHEAEEEESVAAIVFNPGAYTHTSRALRDGIASLSIPVIEVHISNIAAREEWRRESLLAEVCVGSIAGFGTMSYQLGLQAALSLAGRAT